jgi:ABC-type bacteriocin/lantibiotic exporter with double-glycine peptidase domain
VSRVEQPKILIFDKATSNLDQQMTKHFATIINQFKGKVTMLLLRMRAEEFDR